MAVINGTVKGVHLLEGNPGTLGARKVYSVVASFAAYTGSADTATITGVGAQIKASTRNGRTNTVIAAIPGHPGTDTAGQAVYFTGTSVQAATVSSDDLSGQLSVAAGTELTSATASSNVEVIVAVDES
jgi:hypothetical protein